jgi:putative membrane protein
VILYRSRLWSQVLLNAHRSPVLRQVLVGALGFGVYAWGVSLGVSGGWLPELPFRPALFPLVTLLLSLLLAFRTNTAYDRWWEGRKLWEALTNHTRNLAIFLDSTLPPEDMHNRKRFAILISAYAQAVRAHLRDEIDVKDFQDLDEATRKRLEVVEHVPNLIASSISRRIYELAKTSVINGFELVNLKSQIAGLTETVGACERIKSTPIPFSYATYERHLLLWFCLALPWGLQTEYGIFSVPLTMGAFASLAGLEMLAADIEDPFGSDDSDLPTEQISRLIRRNVYELLVGELPGGEPTPENAEAPPTGVVLER